MKNAKFCLVWNTSNGDLLNCFTSLLTCESMLTFSLCIAFRSEKKTLKFCQHSQKDIPLVLRTRLIDLPIKTFIVTRMFCDKVKQMKCKQYQVCSCTPDPFFQPAELDGQESAGCSYRRRGRERYNEIGRALFVCAAVLSLWLSLEILLLRVGAW